MRHTKFWAAMRPSSSADDETKRKAGTRANSAKLNEVKTSRADEFRGTKTKAEREKEIEVKMEKGRAAAWAWYQHGKGESKEKFSRSRSVSGGSTSALSSTVQGNEHGSKSSRFRTEALETVSHSISLPAPELAYRRREASDHRRTKSTDLRNCSNLLINRTSSLFDSHELDSMSKIIDIAVQRSGPTFSSPTKSELTIHRGKAMPPAVHSPGVSGRFIQDQSIRIADSSQDSTGRSAVTTNSSRFRLSLHRYSCGSVSDVVTREEMSLGNTVRNDGQKTKASGASRRGWNPGRIARVYSLPRI